MVSLTDDSADDERLGIVAMTLMGRGLEVRVLIDKHPRGPDGPLSGYITARNPASGEYAQVYYLDSGSGSGHPLELVYQTDREHDPDGSQLAERVIRLLSTAPMPDRTAEDV
jgi:hypothetical protein